jgi:hypothetical protein
MNSIKNLFKLINGVLSPKISSWTAYLVSIITSKIYPIADSSTAIQITKADTISPIINIDTSSQITTLKQIGTNATSTATQKSSSILEFENSGWNGTAEVKTRWVIQCVTSTISNNLYSLTIFRNTTPLFSINQDGTITTTTLEQKNVETRGNFNAQIYRHTNTTVNNSAITSYRNAGAKQVFNLKVVNTSHNATTGTADLILQVCKSGGAIADEHIFKSDGSVGFGTTTPTSKLQVVGLLEYADNTSAIAGGLTAGAFYRTY